MIVALLVLIVAILLFGAGVVKGFLANAISLGCGGMLILLIALWLGSFLGEYGLLWVIGIVVALFGLAVLVEEHVRKRELDKLLGRNRPGRRPPPKPDVQHFHSDAPPKDERKRLSRALRDAEKRPPS